MICPRYKSDAVLFHRINKIIRLEVGMLKIEEEFTTKRGFIWIGR